YVTNSVEAWNQLLSCVQHLSSRDCARAAPCAKWTSTHYTIIESAFSERPHIRRGREWIILLPTNLAATASEILINACNTCRVPTIYGCLQAYRVDSNLFGQLSN